MFSSFLLASLQTSAFILGVILVTEFVFGLYETWESVSPDPKQMEDSELYNQMSTLLDDIYVPAEDAKYDEYLDSLFVPIPDVNIPLLSTPYYAKSNIPDYESMTVAELRKIARSLDMKGARSARKSELVAYLNRM